jgi:hypothetical protein
MGLEYRTFILLAAKAELKKRELVKSIPKAKDGEYMPHEAFVGENESVKETEETLLFFPHDRATEVRFLDADDKDGPLSVRHVVVGALHVECS